MIKTVSVELLLTDRAINSLDGIFDNLTGAICCFTHVVVLVEHQLAMFGDIEEKMH